MPKRARAGGWGGGGGGSSERTKLATAEGFPTKLLKGSAMRISSSAAVWTVWERRAWSSPRALMLSTCGHETHSGYSNWRFLRSSDAQTLTANRRSNSVGTLCIPPSEGTPLGCSLGKPTWVLAKAEAQASKSGLLGSSRLAPSSPPVSGTAS